MELMYPFFIVSIGLIILAAYVLYTDNKREKAVTEVKKGIFHIQHAEINK